MSKAIGIVLMSFLSTIVLAHKAQAISFNEIGDAGDILSTAQIIPSTGSNGSITPDSILIDGYFDTTSDVDLYRLSLAGNSTFSAEVIAKGTTVNDTRLYLFDSTGKGVYANDDIDTANNNLLSHLTSGRLSPLNSGTYYLGITTYDNDAVNSSNNPIFDLTTDSSAIVGPSGAGSATTLDHWLGATAGNGEVGSYVLRLTGVQVSAPTTSTPVPESDEVLATLVLGILMPAFGRKNQLKHRKADTRLT